MSDIAEKIKKVDASKENENSSVLAFENRDSAGLRVLIAGNSITRHGPKPDIGWNNDWGMAASSKENDYVHVLKKMILKDFPDATFCICQASGFEVNYTGDLTKVYKDIEGARNFNADVIIVKLLENCFAIGDFVPEAFEREYPKFIEFLNPKGTKNIIAINAMYRTAADETFKKTAADNGYIFLDNSYLSDDKSRLAVGLFEHEGVASHPCDKGMKQLAEDIYEVFKTLDIYKNKQEAER